LLRSKGIGRKNDFRYYQKPMKKGRFIFSREDRYAIGVNSFVEIWLMLAWSWENS